MPARTLGVAAAISDGAIVPGDVAVDDGHVARIGVQPAGRGGIAAAGFVDVQVNGFAGVDFLAASPEDLARAGAAMAATGVTSYQPTFISSPERVTLDAIAVVRDAMSRRAVGPRVLGVHLEGPFLSPVRFGAHNPDNLRVPDPGLTERLLGSGTVTHMTVAPELPGGLELVERLVASGVVVAIGHSDADTAAAHAAFDRGARAVTHLFNAQHPLTHRDPGLPGVALVRGDVTVTLIVDDVHLAPEITRLAWRAASGRFALVTDAIEAAGLPPGAYTLGDREVVVADGAVRLSDGTLAGSVLTMDVAVRNLMRHGVGMVEALDAAAGAPARLLRRADLGALRHGAPADLIVIDDDVTVMRTLVGGVEVFAR